MSVVDSSEGKTLAPNFVRVCADRDASEGKMTRFDCRVTGRPYPEVHWFINGRQVSDDATHKILVNESGNHALMITNVSRSDAGIVSCIARNKSGETSFQVILFASLEILLGVGCEMAKAVGHILSLDALVQSQVGPCEIWGGQSGTGTVFLSFLSFLLSLSFHQYSVLIYLSVARYYNWNKITGSCAQSSSISCLAIEWKCIGSTTVVLKCNPRVVSCQTI